MLFRSEVDFGIGPVPDRTGDLHCEPLFTEPIVALMKASHPAAGKAGVSLHELSKGSVLRLGASGFRKQLASVLEQEGLAPDLQYEFTHVSTMVAMVEAGLGVGILPSIAAPPSRTLKAVRLVRPAMTRTLAVITIRGHRLSPAAARFVEMCGALAPPRRKAPVS